MTGWPPNCSLRLSLRKSNRLVERCLLLANLPFGETHPADLHGGLSPLFLEAFLDRNGRTDPHQLVAPGEWRLAASLAHWKEPPATRGAGALRNSPNSLLSSAIFAISHLPFRELSDRVVIWLDVPLEQHNRHPVPSSSADYAGLSIRGNNRKRAFRSLPRWTELLLVQHSPVPGVATPLTPTIAAFTWRATGRFGSVVEPLVWRRPNSTNS
jgi:hypothetical protein